MNRKTMITTVILTAALVMSAHAADVNLLDNPGFESGALTPWVTSSWFVTSSDSHSGSYSAEATSGATIKQFITPVDVSLVNEVSVWCRSVDEVEHPVQLLYSASGGDWDEFLMFPTTSYWDKYDLTSNLRATGLLHGLLVFGSYGHVVRCDDGRIMVDESVANEPAAWSQVKRLYH